MRLIGLDVAGWHDVAARDWDTDHADEADSALRIVDGGVGSVAVRDRSGRWIGGPQAALAPHGLGKGWGELGGADRRVSIAECHDALIAGREANRDAYFAALESLSRHAEEAILNVPDLPAMDEAARTRVLGAVRGKLRRTRLLWRPVALFLEALASGLVSPQDAGRNFGFLIHSGNGFEFQTLRLRQDSEHPGHFAPEREGYGSALGQAHGLCQLTDRIHAEVVRANPILAEERCGKIELASGLLAGRVTLGSRHVVRHDNGNWIELKAPEQISLANMQDLAGQVAADLQKRVAVDKLFVATPLAPDLAASLLGALQIVHAKTVQMPWTALAAGALRAGRLIEKGLPHYFDRLTPIALAVIQGGEPAFAYLIDKNAMVPANREYVSTPYRELEWPAAKNEIEFCILKGEAEIRQWKASVAEAPGQTVPVELVIRQTPGQSWAKVDLLAHGWDALQRSPISLDWENLKPLKETPDEVLQRFRTPPPTIPTRIVERAGMEFWDGGPKITGMLPIILGGEADGLSLAKLLPRSLRVIDGATGSHERVWPIGTDGELPAGISPEDAAAFERVIAPVAEAVLTAARTGRALGGNDELRALTWMFTRCPDAVQSALVEALEADHQGNTHALLRPLAARTVVVQGAGRAVTGAERIRRVLNVLAAAGPNANNNTFNALAMLLARRRETPAALDRKLVATIARIVADELESVARTRRAADFKVRFKNALSALAGLFRYRETEPYALLKADDPTALRLSQDLEKIQRRLTGARAFIPQADVKIALVNELLELLEGRGDPDILRRIEASQ